MKLTKWLSDSLKNKNRQTDEPILENENDNGCLASDDLVESSPSKNEDTEALMPLVTLANKVGYCINNINEFFIHNGVLSENEEDFYSDLNQKAAAILERLQLAEDMPNEDLPSEDDTQVKELKINMSFEIFVTRDLMKAYGFIFPPIGTGNSLEFEEIIAVAEKKGVTYGIDTELLKNIINDKAYFKIFTLAEGIPPQDGTDGQLIDRFSREKQINLSADKDEIIDFRNLNWLQKVAKGEVICEIIQPIPAVDGINVRAKVLKAKEGKSPKLPKGKNVVENEEKTALVAEVDGQLTFTGGIFKVEQLLQIDGDVDSSVGNLDVIGSITIKGNVSEGFSVKSTGDILVSGVVAGAILYAGGNIKIIGGMNGSYKGKLEAGGTVSCKFLENCFVSATGTVIAESIINSTVSSSDKIIVNSGHGAIIGSTISCLKGVEAKVIGNDRYLMSKISIGTDPKLAEEMRVTKKELTEMRRKSEEMEKNILYLSKLEKLDEAHQQLFNKLKLDFSILNMNISKKASRVEYLEQVLTGDDCRIVAKHILPPLSVTIGTITQQFETESHLSKIYKRDGEIVIGV